MSVQENAPQVPAPETCAQLILAIARDADRTAFAALFQHFAPRLKAYLIRTGTPANAAEELAQEAMLSVWRKAAMFDPGKAGASTWIFTIARNLRIDSMRRERHPDALRGDPSDENEAPLSADAMLVNAEREEKLRTALKCLSEDQLKVVRLSFFLDHPHAEIARQLDIPLGTVKSRLRIAMERLRSALDDI